MKVFGISERQEERNLHGTIELLSLASKTTHANPIDARVAAADRENFPIGSGGEVTRAVAIVNHR